MKAEILCVGTEILLGDIVNTNAAYLAKELALRGIEVYHQTVVGDNPERLKDALEIAFERADMVVMTGGLGPTYDDLTKETVANYFGREMEMHLPSLEKIEYFFRRRNTQMTENNKKQALMPVGAVIFENNNGTAPGLAVEGDGKVAILLPGPPAEMKPMFQDAVAPYLKKFTGNVLVSHSIHIIGMGESVVEDRLKEMMVSHKNPTIAPYAKQGEVLLRVTASAPTPEEADALTQPVIQEIVDQLKEYVYGIDVGDLQHAAVALLKEKGKKVAVAESCTGGLVAKRLTDIPGASEVFDCSVTAYHNRIKEQVLGVKGDTLLVHGAVSEETAAEMARGVRLLAGADIGLSTTGIAGPDGGTEEKPVGLVYMGIDMEGFSKVVELRVGRGRKNERDYIRYVASSNALRLLISALQSL